VLARHHHLPAAPLWPADETRTSLFFAFLPAPPHTATTAHPLLRFVNTVAFILTGVTRSVRCFPLCFKQTVSYGRSRNGNASPMPFSFHPRFPPFFQHFPTPRFVKPASKFRFPPCAILRYFVLLYPPPLRLLGRHRDSNGVQRLFFFRFFQAFSVLFPFFSNGVRRPSFLYFATLFWWVSGVHPVKGVAPQGYGLDGGIAFFSPFCDTCPWFPVAAVAFAKFFTFPFGGSLPLGFRFFER